MSTLYQCPYSKATKCNLKDPCYGCEQFCEFLKQASRKTPSVSENEGKKRICPKCKGKQKYVPYTNIIDKCNVCNGDGQI